MKYKNILMQIAIQKMLKTMMEMIQQKHMNMWEI